MNTQLRSVAADPLPEYPEELFDPHLTNDYFTAFWHDRWLSSRLHLTGSLAVQGAALNLFFLSRKQVPVGSLPEDPEMLARLLRISSDEWRSLMAQAITPLHKWGKYSYRGDVVLGHPVVIEVARDALVRREARRASNEERAVAMRRQRLVGLMRDHKCSDPVCADKALVAWLDDWLEQHHHGQRRRPQIDASLGRALEAAAREGRLPGTNRR